MWSVAYKTLLADRGKFFTALAGVMFAYVLANVQGGLYLGLLNKASILVDQSQADIWIGHRKIHNIDFARIIPLQWINRIRSLPQVQSAEPYLVNYAMMTLPSGGFEMVIVVGSPAPNFLGIPRNVADGQIEHLLQPDAIVIDEFEDDKLGNPRIGDVREIGGKRARVVAKTKGLIGFLVSPYVFTTFDRAIEYTRVDPNCCTYYLVKLRDGQDPRDVCGVIEYMLPELDAYTREEYSRISVNYWMTRTGIGISFGGATAMGLLIGLVMVAQSLYALVLDRLHEFATLKAIGSSEKCVLSVLFMQAILVAFVGVIAGMIIVFLVREFCSSPKAPIIVPWWLTAGTTLLVVCICLLSAVIPYLRIRRLDPVMVLQA